MDVLDGEGSALPPVEYLVSTRESRFIAYQNKHGVRSGHPEGKITLFVDHIWLASHGDIDSFVRGCIAYTLIEHTCMELAFNGIRCKGNKCLPCLMLGREKHPVWDAAVDVATDADREIGRWLA